MSYKLYFSQFQLSKTEVHRFITLVIVRIKQAELNMLKRLWNFCIVLEVGHLFVLIDSISTVTFASVALC